MDYGGLEGKCCSYGQDSVTMDALASCMRDLEEYLERDASFTQTGAFTLQGDVLTLEQQNDGPRYFRLAQDSATMLDRSQQPITGALAAHYVLRKK